MKKRLSVLCFLLLSVIINAQTPEWIWAENAQNENYCSLGNVEVSNNGKIYVSGVFIQHATIGGITMQSNDRAFFIAEYDTDGSVLWTKVFPYYSGITSLVTDSQGYIYATGNYNDDLAFEDITLENPQNTRVFLAKFDSNGNVIWVKNTTGNSTTIVYKLNIDANDNVYMCGYYSGASVTFENTTLTNNGGRDFYLAKYDSDGNLTWVNGVGGTGNETAYSLDFDDTGAIYVGGAFSSTTFSIGTTTLTCAGQSDIFLAKYDTNGAPIWSYGAGGENNEYIQKLVVDSEGNTYSAGNYYDSLTLGSTTLGNYNQDDSASPDIFITKHDANGNLIWAKRCGSYDLDYISELISDDSNNIYLTGISYYSNFNIGGFTVPGDIFVAKLDSNGDLIWHTAMESFLDYSDISRSTDIALDGDGEIYVSGFYSYDITIGDTELNDTSTNNMFLAKLQDVPLSVTDFSTEDISLYPNPTQNTLNILCDTEISLYSIIDMAGRTIQSGNVKNNIVDVSSLPKGLYILDTQNGAKTKFIKN